MPIMMFNCQYCEDDLSHNIPDCIKHEKGCGYNPENKCCNTCKHLLIGYDEGFDYREGRFIEYPTRYDCLKKETENMATYYKDEGDNSIKSLTHLRDGICSDWELKEA